jgi:IS1 family transposase
MYNGNGQKKKDRPLYIQWSKETAQTIIHTMVKRNRTDHYTYNGQKKQDRPLYIQWSKETAQTIIHTMVKRNRTDHYTYNGVGSTTSAKTL